MAELIPVDHDPFAPPSQAGFSLVPVDHDPFAPAAVPPSSATQPQGSLTDYPVELGKGFLEGAKNTAAAGLKGYGANAAGRAQTQLNAMDASAAARPGETPHERAAYRVRRSVQHATPEVDAERRAALQQQAAKPIQDNPLYRAGAAIEGFGKETLAPRPGFEGSWTRDIGSGFGSVVTGIGAAMVPTVGPALAGSIFLGAGMGEAVDRALAAGATKEQAVEAARLGAYAGATDVVDALIPLMGGTGKALGLIKRVGIKAVYGALAEGGQEGFQQFLQNWIAQGVYKPDQDLMQDVPRSVAIGAIVGGVTGGVAGGAQRQGNQPQAQAQPDVPGIGEPIETQPAQTEPQGQITVRPVPPAERGQERGEPVSELPPAVQTRPEAAAPPTRSTEDALLQAYGYSPDQIAEMSPTQRSHEIAEALDQGIGGHKLIPVEGDPFAPADDTGMNVPESRATLEAQQQQLLEGDRPAQMFPAGTEPLPLPKGMASVETPRGVYHFNPNEISASEIIGASLEGRENEILALGPVNKAEAVAREQAGETPLAVTERAPDGTEVKAAAGTDQTAPAQIAALEASATPGNSVSVESVERVLADRQEAAPTGSEIVMLTPDQINIDAARFQYKMNSDAHGVTGALKGVAKWDDRLANPILAWQANDGQVFVANGHQRTDLAKRASSAGQENVRLPARIYREADGYSPDFMKALGAYQNIAEGTGTATDAARILRANQAALDLPELPPRSQLVQDAKALTALSDDAFGMVVNGVVPESYAAQVGRLLKEPTQQVAALDVLARAQPANAEQARIIVEDIRNAGFLEGEQVGLFGEEQFARSLVAERARILDQSIKTLRRLGSTFKTAVEQEGTLAEAGNVLSRDANVKAKTDNERLAEILRTDGTRKGPISDALSDSARELADGKRISGVVSQFLSKVRSLARGQQAGLQHGAAPDRDGHAGEEEGGALFSLGRGQQRPVAARLSGDEIGRSTNFGHLRMLALRYARENLAGREVVNAATGMPITINWQGLKKSVSGPRAEEMLRALPAIPQMLEQGTLVSSHADKRGRNNIKAIHTFESAVQVGNRTIPTRLVVRETGDGRFFYDFDDMERASRVQPGAEGGETQVRDQDAARADENISQDQAPEQGEGTEELYSVLAGAPPAYSLSEHPTIVKRILSGDITADELREHFDRLVASEASIKAELNAKTLKELAPRGTGGQTKKKIVDAIFDQMVGRFAIGDGLTWSPFSETMQQAVRRKLASVTDETIAEAARKRAERIAQQKQTYTDPQTLPEFRSFIAARGEAALTSEQRARFDELTAEQNRASAARDAERSAIIKKVEVGDAGMSLVETKHSQKGHDLFVVRLDRRVDAETYRTLNTSAKRLGGYYSSYARDGAVPGFQFKTRDAAERFMALKESDQSRADLNEAREKQVQDNAVSRLRDMAERLTESADETISADRKVNTERRARMAAGAEARASADKAMAQSMLNLASAIEGGEAKRLDWLRNKTDIEALDRVLRVARRNWVEAQKPANYGEREKLEQRPFSVEMIDAAQFPYPHTHRETAAEMAQVVSRVPGAMMAARRILKMAHAAERRGEWSVRAEHLGSLDDLRTVAEAASKIDRTRWQAETALESFADYNRLKRIGLNDLPTLRAALREYLKFRGAPAKVDPVKAAERALMGRKIPGYFPTPESLADRMVDEAGIQPGMSVLEPSAGKGNIADKLVASSDPGAVSVIEPVGDLRAVLEMKGHNIVGSNFLDHDGSYDRIVMNPPFEDRQDVEHVRHAFGLLKPRGRLVAIMSEGPFFGSDRRAVDFRQWLDSVDGVSEQLPAGTFLDSERSTGVATRIVTVDKPAAITSPSPGVEVAEKSALPRQTALPGTEPISDGRLAQRRADAPLKPKVAQKNADFGLFGDGKNQGELFDAGQHLRAKAQRAAPAIERRLTEIVRGIAGEHVKVAFPNRVALPSSATKAWGSVASGRPTASGKYVPADRLIAVAIADPRYQNPESTAFHEAFHAIEHLLLTDEEMAVLKKDEKVLRSIARDFGGLTPEQAQDLADFEVRAIAFEAFANARESKQSVSGFPAAVRRIFEKLRNLLGRVRNALRGAGFKTAQDIFTDAYEGRMAGREAKPRAIGGAQANVQAPLPFSEPAQIANEVIADQLEARNLPKLAKISRALKVGKINTTETRAQVQDKFIRWKKVQQAVEKAYGRPLPDAMNVYTAESLYYGRTGERLEKLDKEQIDPLIEDIKKRGLTLAQVDEFLMARHAPERNATIRKINPNIADPSGMSDERAAEVIEEAESRGKLEDLEAVEKRVRKLIDDTRNTLVRGGLISEQTAEQWKRTYPNYVPLRGWQEGDGEADATSPGVGRGFEIRGPEARQALGRTSVADSPLGYALMQAQQAIVRAEKNRVGLTALRFVQNHPEPDLWKINKGDKRRVIDPATGLVTEAADPAWILKPNVFAVKIDGTPHYINFQGEDGANLARALKSLGTANMHPALRFVGALTRLQARLATSWNPDFMIPNFIRDAGEAFINLQEQQQKGFVKAFAKHLLPAIGGSFTALRGAQGGKYADAFREFDKAGGRIRFFGLENVDDIKANIASKMRQLEGGTINNLRTAGKKAVDAIEIANGSIENATRLAAFMAARDVGLSPAKAASIARELTVNFNRKGELGSIISALYMFANAAMQGQARMLQAMYGSSKVRRFAYGIAAAGSLIALYNLGAGGDDEDGTAYYTKIPKWERDTNLILMWPKGMGRDGQYVKIPLPYGYAMFHVLGARATTAAVGKEKPSKAIGAMATAVLDAFDPLGHDANMLAQFTPTIGRPAVHIATNQNWTGRPLNPDPMPWNKAEPDSQRSFRSTSEFSKAAAPLINKATGGSKHEPGWIDWSPGSIDHMLGFVTGGLGRFMDNTASTAWRGYQGQEWQPEKTPIVRRFIGQKSDQADRALYFEDREAVQNAKARAEAFRKDGDGKNALRYAREHRAELGAAATFATADRQRSMILKEIDRIKADTALSAAAKEAKVKEQERREMKILNAARAALSKARESSDRVPSP